MVTYYVLVRIAGVDGGDAVGAICRVYKDAVPVRVREQSTLYKFQVSAHTTVNDINARLSEIKGIKVVSVVPRRSDIVANLRRYWGWLCVVSAWAALCVASGVMQEDPLENLNNLQEILLYSAIAMAIVAWAYHIGRKSMQRLSIYAAAAELAAQEACERARRAAKN